MLPGYQHNYYTIVVDILYAVEFPAVLLDLQTGEIVDEFQQYVLPRDNPKLSDFCKTLTGISQVNYNDCNVVSECLHYLLIVCMHGQHRGLDTQHTDQ